MEPNSILEYYRTHPKDQLDSLDALELGLWTLKKMNDSNSDFTTELFGTAYLDDLKARGIFLYVSKMKPLDKEGKRFCLWCGKFLKGRRRKYCSDDHGFQFYNEWKWRFSWEYIRLGVIARDKNICQQCREKFPDSQLEVHHLIPRTLGGKDVEENLQTLCQACHKKKTKKLMGDLAKSRKKEQRKRENYSLDKFTLGGSK
jgi:hypothetical protein